MSEKKSTPIVNNEEIERIIPATAQK
ncbi:hypothetical protein RDI58_029326 [Solanum bulbocastanum]|uniref:Uncharacterized protein n=1 Tax=Solanum bulbocastanum TaxID=147425 RepID=A0AAN8Y0A3_SOLBU